MTRLFAYAAVLIALPSLGCASRAKVRTQAEEIERLKAQLAAVQREQTAAREQNESIRNELFILHDRVATARTALARTQQAPPKLEVVKLTPGPSADPLAARVKPVRLTPIPEPEADEGYDPSADEAEMFSFANDDSEAARSSDAIALAAPSKPAGKPTKFASVQPAPAVENDPLPAALAGTKTSGPKEDPMKMYQRAFGVFQKKDYGEAMLAFETFVRAYPSHEYADNAYYWMGECFYAQTEYALAIEEFQKIPELYPGGNKVPDAMLKIGLAYQSLNNTKSAARTFRQLVDAYPQSEAAELGRQRLAKLPQP